MALIPSIDVTASALQASKYGMNITAENIANQFTTRGPDGKVYRAKEVSFESLLMSTADGSIKNGVQVGEVTEDKTPGNKIYNPNHPHADENGMLEMPNVNLSQEMVNLIEFNRNYEANLVVAKTSREMARLTLRMGK